MVKVFSGRFPFLPSLMLALSICLSAAPARGTMLYGIETVQDSLFTVENTTGAVNIVGPLGVEWFFGGIAFDSSGNLFGVEQSDGFLYTINKDTGQATFVGATGTFNPESLAIIDNVGYTQARTEPGGPNMLYSIALGTGTATEIGSYEGDRVQGLASVNNQLFGTRYTPMELVRLDMATGLIAESIGAHGLGSGTSLAWADDRFWMIPTTTGNLYSLNPTDAVPTLEFSGLSLGHVTALTAAPIPEPSTLLLLGTGLLGVVGIARRRKS